MTADDRTLLHLAQQAAGRRPLICGVPGDPGTVSRLRAAGLVTVRGGMAVLTPAGAARAARIGAAADAAPAPRYVARICS